MTRHRTTADIRQLDRVKLGVVLAFIAALALLVWSNRSTALTAPANQPTVIASIPPTDDESAVAPSPTAPPSPTQLSAPSPAPTTTPTPPPPATAVLTTTSMPTASPTSLPTTCVGPEGQDLGNRYIVGACDTLIQISRLTGVSLQALIAANPDIQDPDLIFPGQVVVVPRP